MARLSTLKATDRSNANGPPTAGPTMVSTMDAEATRLFVALGGDPDSVADSPGNQAIFLGRTAVLRGLAGGLERAGLDALLVKGAALALTTYEPPWTRPMSDVDVLVRPGQAQAVISALESAGAERLGAEVHGETVLHARRGVIEVAVEVHTTLDKVAPRSLDLPGIFARSMQAPGKLPFRVPDALDHVLLLAQHAASHELRHPLGLVDLHVLLSRGVDRDTLFERAHTVGLEKALYACFSALFALRATSVDRHLVNAVDPGFFNRVLLSRAELSGASALAPRHVELGATWVARQALLRDDRLRFALGAARFALSRAKERALGR